MALFATRRGLRLGRRLDAPGDLTAAAVGVVVGLRLALARLGALARGAAAAQGTGAEAGPRPNLPPAGLAGRGTLRATLREVARGDRLSTRLAAGREAGRDRSAGLRVDGRLLDGVVERLGRLGRASEPVLEGLIALGFPCRT